jgi:enoyl-CoA hydratase
LLPDVALAANNVFSEHLLEFTSGIGEDAFVAATVSVDYGKLWLLLTPTSENTMSEFLLVTIQDRVCTLTLNRPEVLNALNYALFEELNAAIKRLAAGEEDVGCVILRGSGKAFSSGHDLKDIAAGSEGSHSEFEAAVLEALAGLPMPVIAEVHGYCFTGALELALACDLIFIDGATKLADTHSKWGLSPVWGMTQRLPRRIGPARAKDLMFSCRLVESDEALAIGLVDRVLEVGQLHSETLLYAQSVVENSPHSHRVCKEIIGATDGMRMREGLDHEYANSPGACSDVEQRLAAFLSKSS